MKNKMILVVSLATTLTFEYGTIHVYALHDSFYVNYAEHDFLHAKEAANQEDDMEYQNAVEDAKKKQEILDSVTREYEHAKNASQIAKAKLEEQCTLILNERQSEVDDAQKNESVAREENENALKEVALAENNLEQAQKEYEDASEAYESFLKNLHIPDYEEDRLQEEVQQTNQEILNAVSEKNEVNIQIASAKLAMYNKYLDLSFLQTTAELKYEEVVSAQNDLNASISTYNSSLSDIATYDAALQQKQDAQEVMDRCSEILTDYNTRKANWESVKQAGVNENNYMYNSLTGYYYTPESVDSYLSDIYKIIRNNTNLYNDSKYTLDCANTALSSFAVNREQLVAKNNADKQEADRFQSVFHEVQSQYEEAIASVNDLKNEIADLSFQLDEMNQNIADCDRMIETCNETLKTIQEEIEALASLREFSNSTDQAVNLTKTRSSLSFIDLLKKYKELKQTRDTAKEALNDASNDVVEKKQIEEAARIALQKAETETKKAKEKYETACTAILEATSGGTISISEFQYLNQYLEAYNSALAKEQKLKQSYETAKLEYDIASGKIAVGSDLYNKHMKYLDALKEYEKLVSNSSDIPDTNIKKTIENTSVTSHKTVSSQIVASAILVSSVIFVTYSILNVHHKKTD